MDCDVPFCIGIAQGIDVRSLVLNWKMPGTEHPLAVSETVCCFLAYLQGVGSLLGLDFARHPSPRGAPSMAVGNSGFAVPIAAGHVAIRIKPASKSSGVPHA